MCGIAGAIALRGARSSWPDPLDRIVERMAQRMVHRGPDASGRWSDSSGRVAFAHRRLSIIDLSETGRQPMSYADRFWITFNGEVYNFKSLRSQLRALGHTFRGESDTEILLASVAEWGIEEALGRCVGMFAFALWDEREHLLHLGRDRMGEKPLYLGEVAGYLFFASELRAFRAIPQLDARISCQATSAYLRDGCVSGAHSLYDGIYKLPPGHLLTVQAGRAQRLSPTWPYMADRSSPDEVAPRSYWSCRRAADLGRDSIIADEAEAIKRGDELLRESVRMQMHADVPTGAFLSGGIDSSLITAVMQHQSSQPVRTFTVAFDDTKFDESQYARAIAAHLGTRHEEFSLGEREIVEQVPALVSLMDEPTANGSFFPVYLISRLARTQVTVVLSGDGGDELFAGYNRYALAPSAWRRSRWIPAPLRRGLAGALAAGSSSESAWLMRKMMRVGSQVGSADTRRKLARILTAATFTETYLRLTSWWTEPERLNPGLEAPMRDWPAQFKDDLPSMLLADQINYLPDDNLAKVDRASMAASLETRLPLLDHRLVEFSWRLPDSLKLRGRTTKWLLRAILDRYLPRSLIERPKMGFTVPIDQWLRGPLRSWAGDMLGNSAFHRLFPIEPAVCRRLWDEYLAGHGPAASEIWALVVLSAWADAAQLSSVCASAG